MDKQKDKIKQIDQMYEDIPSFVGNAHQYGMCVHHRELVAEALVNKGYGNIKQAVNEFAEKVFNCLKGYNLSYFDGENVRELDDYQIASVIYGIKKEVCGE